MGRIITVPFPITPVRGFWFDENAKKDFILKAYDIFNLDRNFIPNREQLSEIWFTFNILTNFILMPAITSGKSTRLINAIQFLKSLAQGYPEDPFMRCLLYYLMTKSNSFSKKDLARYKNEALAIFNASKLWKSRNENFGISEFLEDRIPEVPNEVKNFIANFPFKNVAFL